MIFGRPIISLVFGPDFHAAYPVVVVFAIGYVCQAFLGQTDMLLKVTDNEWVVLRAIALGIVANLALNALLIPWLGTVGAALASVVVTLGVKIYLCREIRRRLGVSAFALAAVLPKPKSP